MCAWGGWVSEGVGGGGGSCEVVCVCVCVHVCTCVCDRERERKRVVELVSLLLWLVFYSQVNSKWQKEGKRKRVDCQLLPILHYRQQLVNVYWRNRNTISLLQQVLLGIQCLPVTAGVQNVHMI